MDVLVLDGRQRSALAATRSLGRAGHRVWVGDESARSLASVSRFCHRALAYPSPDTSPEKFLEWFEEQSRVGGFQAAMPMTEVTTDLLARHRARWPTLSVPFPSIEIIDSMSDKVKLYERAMRLNVPVPDSVVVASSEDLARAVKSIGFPAILKPRRSRLWTGKRFYHTSVRRAGTRGELETLRHLPEFRDEPFLYQRIVGGEGMGIFALYLEGQAIAFFSHRRIREKPPEGGVSVLSESCSPDEALLDYAKRLLDDAQWTGVAMVEFKGGRGSEAALMEVNARFWGSLQLAIDAGIDFPALLLESAVTGQCPAVPPFKLGQRLRWLLGDLDRLYLVLRRNGPLTSSSIRETVNFLRPDFRRTRHETFRWSDPMPAIMESITYFKTLL